MIDLTLIASDSVDPRRSASRVLPRFVLSALFCAVLVSLALPVEGRSVQAGLKRARQAFKAQEYERALKQIQPIVANPLATISQKIDGLELMGLSYLILGDQRRAREAFENLLGLDSSHRLRDPTGSPKLEKFFESVKQTFLPGYDPKKKARLEHLAPLSGRAGRRVELSVRLLEGAAVVERIAVRWRRGGMLTYATSTMRRRGRGYTSAFFLPTDRSDYRLEYYIEARSRAGHAVARLGSPGHPLTLEVSGQARSSASKPFYRRWWFWTIVGAAVLAGATSAIVAGRERAPRGSLDNVTLELRF